MSERPNFERSPEMEESDHYKELEEAQAEQDKIWEEMEEIFKSEPDRAVAEQRVIDQCADRMDNAIQKTKEVFESWSESMEKTREDLKRMED